MRASIDELKDPAGLLVAIATVGAAWLVKPNALIAVAAGISVLLVKAGSAAILRRRHPAFTGGRHPELTPRELEVARYVPLGLTNSGIALRMGIRERTVDNHIQHIYERLGIHSRAQLAAWLAEHDGEHADDRDGGRKGEQ